MEVAWSARFGPLEYWTRAGLFDGLPGYLTYALVGFLIQRHRPAGIEIDSLPEQQGSDIGFADASADHDAVVDLVDDFVVEMAAGQTWISLGRNDERIKLLRVHTRDRTGGP